LNISEIDNFLDQQLATASLKDQEEIRRNNMIVPEELTGQHLSPWLNRTGWLDLLSNQDIEQLCIKTNAHIEGDEPFIHVRNSIQRVIRKCLQGIRDFDKQGWNLIRFWLNSVVKDKCDKTPFQLYYDSGTLDRYSGYWVRLFFFILRTMNDDSIDGVKYTGDQKRIIHDLRQMIDEEVPDEETIDQLILKVSQSLIEQSDFSEYISPIKYYCSVMGWDSMTERWRRPSTYTPFLAGMQFCIRVLGTEIALPSDERDIYLIRYVPESPTPLDDFKRYWNKWLVEGEPSAFNWIHTLMIYGMHIAADSKGEDKLRFSHDSTEMYWQGNSLNVAAWRRFPGDILKVAEKVLSRELLFQESDTVESLNPYILEPNEGCMDNMYWFGNSVIGHADTARNTIIKNLGNRVRNMIVQQDGVMMWKPQILTQYRISQNKFREYMLICFNILGGLTGRGPEILSVKYRNSVNMDRHLIIRDGQVVLVTQYHKSQNVTDAIKV